MRGLGCLGVVLGVICIMCVIRCGVCVCGTCSMVKLVCNVCVWYCCFVYFWVRLGMWLRLWVSAAVGMLWVGYLLGGDCCLGCL